MKKWTPLVLWLLFIGVAAFAQTTTVSGNVKTISPNLPPNTNGSYVEFTLVNCGNNTPLVNGVAVLLPSPVDFFADAAGAITAAANGGIQPTLYGNDVITCGGAFSSRYSVRYFVGGVAQGPTKFYYVASNVPFNISTATPIVLLPPLVYPNTTVCPPGSYSSGINRDLSVQCTNLPGTGVSDAVVTDPSAQQTIGPQPLILQGPLTAPIANNIKYSQPGDTVSSIETACSTACTYVVTQPQVISLAANHTLASTVTLQFAANGSWAVNGSGFTLTLASQVYGALTPHFSGTATLKFGRQQALVPVEWFGAVGNGSTDNKVAIQATLNALTQGQALLQAQQYNHSGVLTISTSAVGIKGMGMRILNSAQYASPVATILMNTSASADSIDVAGTSSSANVAFNQFDGFSIERSVLPSGTAAGISLNFTYGVSITHVNVQDAIRGIYVHGTGSQGVGTIENSSVQWGYNGLTETSGSLYGIYIDSADGAINPSLRIRHSFAVANAPVTSTTYGLIDTGTEINDLMVYGFETATLNYGEYINQTGVGSLITSSDIHFYGTINDGCHTSCIYINGLTDTAGAGVEINGGYATTNGSSPLIDIESSTGVRVIGVQIGVALNTLPSACIDVNASSEVALIGNQCEGVHNVGILLNNSSSVAVTGNVLKGNGSTNGLIALTNSSFNAVGMNVLTGTGASMVIDSSSNANSALNTNTIASTLTGVVNAGNNPVFNGSSSWSAGAGAPSGACANGSFYSNSATTTGSFATYQCRGAAWVGQGTAY